MLDGDIPVDFKAFQFTLEEMSSISDVPVSTLRGWLASDTLAPFGQRHHKLGRWLFSGLDCIKARTVGDLINTVGMLPSKATHIGAAVVERFFELGDLASDGKRRDMRIVVTLTGGEPMATRYQWDGDTYAAPLPDRDTPAERYRRPHVIVPADLIILDVADAIFKTLAKEAAHA